MKPLVAVAGSPVPKGGVRGWPLTGAVAAGSFYLNALQRAGGQEAILMPRPIERAEAAELLGRFDALLLMGGGDVHPEEYGQDPRPEVYGVSPERDAFELELARVAVDTGLPLLAICRGIQVLNVALGGTLHQHIGDGGGPISHGLKEKHDWERHSVRVDEKSRLAQIVGADSVPQCASHHHQAIESVAPGLRPVAWAEDGMVEAVEDPSGRVIAVQWHPEVTAAEDAAQQSLFNELVRMAESRKEVKGA